MSETLSIRPIAPSDKPAWTDLWTAYLEFYETTLPEEVFETTFDHLCDPDQTNQCGLLAVSEGQPVGLVHYIYHAHNWKVEPVCYLQDLYATPDTRGTGVGRKLIEAVYEAADAAGAPTVYWLTQDFNTTARRLYDRIGVLTPFIKYNRS